MLIKLRFHFPEIVLGILLAVALFAMGAIFQSSHQPPSAEQAAESNKKEAAKNNADRKEAQPLWIPADSVGLYTAILTAFTGILAGVSIFQGIMLLRADKTTQLSADAAKLAATVAVRAQLPVLTLKQFDIFRRADPGDGPVRMNLGKELVAKLTVAVTFTNLGSNAAEITFGCLEWTIVKNAAELPLPPRYENIIPYTPGVNVITNGNVPLDVPRRNIDLTENQLARLNAAEEFLFIFGFISFNDFLGEPHQIRICGKWAVFPGGVRGGIVWDSETPAEYTKRT
ncbi:MAG: hypothetical protein WBD95_25725 [Xanthobacteraceae bacterium]